MTALETIIVGSGAGVVALALLFYVETARGRRFGEGVRRSLDAVVDWCIVRWHTLMLYIGSGAGRVGLHYLLHRLLRSCAAGLERLRTLVERLQRRNRRIARSVQAARTESHLTAIAEHKHATALSETEKAALKEKSLEG
ncbi:hypothetical protein CL655_01850 [bacterium]|nr:hypothetical protein [bacterium]|tara:strand:- start:149 stop:568 length:420 start_codon:yes stop_codon:yes gene_type:complete